ncbi:MAG TPA: hypothetical protein VF690_16805 [Hymenobacter sp.]
MTDKQKYYHLLALVCEQLPTTAVDEVVRSGHEAGATKLMSVRHGRIINLPWLVDLVRVGMPTFSIPQDLFPAERQPA